MYLFKRGSIYYIQYASPQSSQFKRISTKCRNKRDALNFLSNFREEVEKRENARNKLMLKDYIAQFMNYSKVLHSPSTQGNYRFTLNSVLQTVGDVPLQSINRKMIWGFLEQRMAISIYRAEQSQTYLNSFFNKAVLDGCLSAHPGKVIKKLKRPVKMPLFFSEEDFQELLKVVEEEDLRDLVLFAVNTGLRRNELLTLEWYQINIADRILILDNLKYVNKGKKVSTLPLNNTALQILIKRNES
jgi:integrase